MSIRSQAEEMNENQKLGLLREADVEFGRLAGANKEQIPGYLLVKINNCSLNEQDIEFFGVREHGMSVSGQGVKASRVNNKERKTVAYFNMNQLVKNGQFTEETVEGVITIDGQEVGRENVNTDAAIYLG